MFEYFCFQGKRRRNRSNVEAMAAKHNNPTEHNEPELTNGRRMNLKDDNHAMMTKRLTKKLLMALIMLRMSKRMRLRMM